MPLENATSKICSATRPRPSATIFGVFFWLAFYLTAMAIASGVGGTAEMLDGPVLRSANNLPSDMVLLLV